MKTPRINERAWAVDVISEINKFASSRSSSIKSAGGEWSVAVEERETVLFPDVLLFADPSRAAVMQGWELKMPDTPITEPELLHKAEDKARALGLTSFVVWNAREAALYLAEKNMFKNVKSWCCNRIASRADVQTCRSDWIVLLGEMLDDLNMFFDSGRILQHQAIDSQVELIVNSIVSRRQAQVGECLKSSASASRERRAEFSSWWSDASVEHPGEDQWSVLSAEIILHWIHRFLFAHYLKRFVSDARVVESLLPAKAPSVRKAERIFIRISFRHDFAQLFRARSGADLIPEGLWSDLLAFNMFLSSARMDEIDQNLLHSVLNSVRSASLRKAAGQFCTPQRLADLLVRLTMDDIHAPVLDPCCGTGTIVKAAFTLKTDQGMKPKLALASTWASDKYAMPLQFATLALASGEAPATTLRVFQHDLATLKEGRRISFVDAETGRSLKERLPLFPCIVLNPPFIRFEDWSKTNEAAAEIRSFISGATGVSLDTKSDLFAFLVLHLWRLCARDNGRVGVVVSNAWLGTEWGNVFRDALLKLFHLEAVVTSGKGRWFKDAKVVTNLLVLRSRNTSDNIRWNDQIAFATTNLNIDEWTEKTTDEVVSSIIRPSARKSSFVVVNRVKVKKLKALDDLGLCWSAHFADLSWLDRVARKLVPIGEYFDIKRGERRGWDNLFFPPNDAGIESCYLRPVLKTSSEASRLIAKPNGQAFCCSEDIDELRRLGHAGAMRWIERFAGAVNEKGFPLREVLQRSGMYWYEMRSETVADLAASMNYDRRLFILRLAPRAFVNQRLIRFTIKPGTGVNLALSHALLCSLMGSFYIEALGFGRGLGVLDLSASKVAKQMRLLNPLSLSPYDGKEILEAFKPLLRRDILHFDKEMRRKDRLLFEDTVLKSFGLADLRHHIVETVLRLHSIRLTARDS